MKKTFSLSGARDAFTVTPRHLLFGRVGIVAGPLTATIDGHVLEGHVPALEAAHRGEVVTTLFSQAIPNENRRIPMKFQHLLAASLVFAAAAVNAQSTTPTDHAAHHLATTSAPTSSVAWTEGEVRKVDKAAGKVTLRHGRIEDLDMPGMTMVFRATDPRLLNGLKEGDKVRFVAGLANGALTVSTIERAE